MTAAAKEQSLRLLCFKRQIDEALEKLISEHPDLPATQTPSLLPRTRDLESSLPELFEERRAKWLSDEEASGSAAAPPAKAKMTLADLSSAMTELFGGLAVDLRQQTALLYRQSYLLESAAATKALGRKLDRQTGMLQKILGYYEPQQVRTPSAAGAAVTAAKRRRRLAGAWGEGELFQDTYDELCLRPPSSPPAQAAEEETDPGEGTSANA